MKWQNKVQLIGYLGKDPTINILPSGVYYATLRLATNSGYTEKGKSRETLWHTIKYWGRKAEYMQNVFIKGSHVLVDGTLVYRSYQDKEGTTRHITEIKAERLVNLDR